MSWKIAPGVDEILRRGRDGEGLEREQAVTLLSLPLMSREVAALMQTAEELSRAHFGDKAENHFHIGVNVAPCPLNCLFCSLTKKAGIFKESVEFSDDQVLEWARYGEELGADALNIMTTGDFSFERLLEIGRLLRRNVGVPLVANTRDINHAEGEALLEAGFVGAYHAVRLGEGRSTPLDPRRRIRTIRVLKDVGLKWLNCVEPVGPEHSAEEIAELMVLAREHGATFSGVMRRVNFPGSPMEPYGMIGEREMARMVGVSRLVMGTVPKAHCTHEPNAISLAAGANLFFPEVGSSPRDGEADTGKGRGSSVERCRAMQREMGWDPDLPSNCFSKRPPSTRL